MLFLNRDLAARHLVLAGVLAAAIPMALGALIFKANPSACYDSPCALPLLLITVPPVAAPLLFGVFALNRRLQNPLPDGWLPTVIFFSIFSQIGISLCSILFAAPNIRRIFLSDILFIPQGFVVGCVVALVFWVALFVLGTKRPGG